MFKLLSILLKPFTIYPGEPVESWANKINPMLKDTVLAAHKAGMPVEYHWGRVYINAGVLTAVRVFDARTGALVAMG